MRRVREADSEWPERLLASRAAITAWLRDILAVQAKG
jgi:hypothetical protein